MLRIAWRLANRIAPGLTSSQSTFHESLDALLAAEPTRLDIGCGRSLVPAWLSTRDLERFRAAAENAKIVVGMDGDEGSLRDNDLRRKVRGDIRRLPFASRSFDLVTANMVVEHLPDPAACLREVRRVLKPGGSFVFHTPNLRSPLVRAASLLPDWLKKVLARFLEDRAEEDVFPTVYRLNSSAQIRSAAAACGLNVADIKLVTTSPATQALGPLVVFELLMIRLLWRPCFAELRPNIIATLVRPAGETGTGEPAAPDVCTSPG